MKANHLRVAAGMALVLALAVWVWPRGKDEADDAGPAAAGGTSTAQASRLADRDAAGHRGSRAEARRTREPLAEHTVEQLKDWNLPAVEGRDVTLKSALGILMSAYKDACQRSRSAPLALEFQSPPDDGARISFSMEHTDFDSALRRIAALAGYRVVKEGTRVSFVAMPASDHPGERSLKVPADFATDLAGELQRLGIRHDQSIGGMLAAAGIVGADRQVTLAANGMLHATVSQTEFERLEARLSGGRPYQFKASVKLVLSDSPLDPDPEDITASQVDEWLQSMAGRNGTLVITVPSATMRDGQESTIEIIRELPAGWTGARIAIAAEAVGLTIISRDTTEYRPDDHPRPYLQGTNHSLLADGEAGISLVGRKEDAFLYRVAKLERIDATGRPLGEPGSGSTSPFELASAVPDSPGFVFSPFNGKVVDVRGIPSGTLVQDPTYPPAEKKYFRIP